MQTRAGDTTDKDLHLLGSLWTAVMEILQLHDVRQLTKNG
jgi:hypothetical protein